MHGKICYLGDGSLHGAASYLAGIMLHYGLAFDYVPGDAVPPPTFSSEPYTLYVVSDYRANRFGAAAMAHVAGAVQQGAGLVMLGGWESFFGRLGEYHQSPLAEVLPVVMHAERRSPQLCSALPHPKSGRASDSGGLAMGRAAGDRRVQCPDGQAWRANVARCRAVRCTSDRWRVSVRARPTLAVVGRRAARWRANRGTGGRRGAALGRRAGRLGRRAGRAGGGGRDDRGRQLVCSVFCQSVGLDGEFSVPSPSGRGLG